MHPKLSSTATVLGLLVALALAPPIMAQSETESEESDTEEVASENGESPGEATSDENEPPEDEGPAIPLDQDPDC
jgi:hypothetical protein